MIKNAHSEGYRLSNFNILTPHDEALFEAGKEILRESVFTGRDFCKSMIGIATGAIPIYLGLLELVWPTEGVTLETKVIAICPPLLSLIAAIIFSIGYFPRSNTISLDILEEIEESITSSIKHRLILSRWGFGVFLLGLVTGGIVIFYNIFK